MDEKEQFRLALKGWKYKGTLNNVYHGPYKLGYNGDIAGKPLRVTIPQSAIDSVEHKNGQTVLFLIDSTYYVLGTKQDGKEKESKR